MKKLIPLVAAAVLGLAVVGCDHNRSDTSADGARPMQAQAAADKTAVATIRPAEQASTQPSMGKATGTVTFTQVGDDKVKVVIDLEGLPPGKHGFHIHEKGDLSAADLSSAGGHFNPGHHHHAGPDSPKRHAGDLGNIKADANGEVKKEMTIGGISVGTGAANDIVGKSVIVHGKADDLKTDPAGNAGPRIAGGVIEEQK